MKKLLLPALLCTLLFSASPVFAQNQNAASLLWRISGNGLSKPSYLFGTMHVNNKSAFNFKDSLYFFLENVDAFAMEVDPDSASNILSSYMNGDLTAEDFNLDKDTEKDLQELEKKLLKRGLLTTKGSQQKLVDYLNGKLVNNDEKEEDGMETFMDAYLYEIARRNNKSIYGLEQISDQVHALKALSTGMRLKNFIRLVDKWNPTKVSPLSQIYLNEQIDSMDLFFKEYYTDSVLNIFLYQRNKVMAAHMAELMKTQSLFTAVGSGHLPGSKGVIALLRQQGYVVEPVFSSHRIPATAYKMKEASLSAVTIKNTDYGFQYNMPKEPKIQNGALGNQIAMQYDIGAGLMYMVISGRVDATEKGKADTAIAHTHLAQFIASASGTLISSQAFKQDSLQGVEALAKQQQTYVRFREVVAGNMFYLFTLTAQKKENLYSDKATAYFSSFKLLPAQVATWPQYEAAEDGFAARFPQQPRTEVMKVNEENENKISWHVYTSFDVRTATSYMVNVSKAKEGSSLNSVNLFDNYIQSIRTISGGQTTVAKDIVVNGCVAKKIEAGKGNKLEGLIVSRDNVSYLVTAEYDDATVNKEDINRFFHSFALSTFPVSKWKQETSPGNDFTVHAPAPLTRMELDKDEDTNGLETFHSFDPVSACYYTVTKNTLNPYWWIENTDSLYAFWQKKLANSWSDSVLQCKAVTVSGKQAVALTVYHKFLHETTQYYFVLNGDDLYTLSVEKPALEEEQAQVQIFFSSFTLSQPKNTSKIFTNTPQQLFNALASTDSITFHTAADALKDVSFRTDDLPLLLQQSIALYPHEHERTSVNEMLVEKLETMIKQHPEEAKTVNAFIKVQYYSTAPQVNKLQFDYLNLLAQQNTQEAYNLIRELLFSELPKNSVSYPFFFTLKESPQWAKTLYPQLFQYLTDSTVGSWIVNITNSFLDSNYLSLSAIKEQKQTLLALATSMLKKLQRNSFDLEYDAENLLQLVARYNDAESNNMLSRFLATKDLYVKNAATLLLLKNKISVPPIVIEKLANAPEYRANLYEALQQQGKEKLFPAAYKSQQSLGESYVRQSMDDEDEEEIITQFVYIKKMDYNYNGTLSRFYLYRVNFKEKGTKDDSLVPEQNSYLGIAGPFALDGTKLSIPKKQNISGVYYEETFDGGQLDNYFKKFIDQ